jgi:hypothetical protein
VWFSDVHPIFAAGTPAPISVSLNQFTAGAIASRSTTLPEFDEIGIIFMDTTKDPATPYLAYENAKDQLMTRALIFNQGANQSGGCDVSAGEFPCARNIDESDNSSSDASPIPTGTIVHLTGGLSDQAVIVESYEAVKSLPSNMTTFSAPLGEAILLSNGLSVEPKSVEDDASCTLLVGCFGNGVNRLTSEIGTGTGTTTAELVPGTIYILGKSAILLLSITNSSSTAIAIFLVSAS